MQSELWKSAAENGLVGCHTCGKVSKVGTEKCPRCGSSLHLRKHNSVQKCLALVFTAITLYIPANALPIMSTTMVGNSDPSTILAGVVLLWHHGSTFIAAIIFIASVFVPLAKIFMLLYICWSLLRKKHTNKHERSKVFVITEIIGRWSMIDVFVVGVLSILIQFSGLMTIEPGPAVTAFAGVVVITMFAAMSLDPRLIWDQKPIHE